MKSKNTANAVKPIDQLTLTPEELNEEHVRVLTTNNPNVGENMIIFSYKERKFKPVTSVDQTHIHIELGGHMMHKDSDDARKYLMEKQSFEEQKENLYSKNLIDKYVDEDGNTKVRILRNKFNFIDRASQTFNNPKRVNLKEFWH